MIAFNFFFGFVPDGRFSGLYLYGFFPSLYFRHLKITYCINSHHRVPVYPFGLTDYQRVMLPVFWRDRRLSSTRTKRYESSDPDWYRRLVESENTVPYVLALTPCACTPCCTSEHRNLREKVGPCWTLALVPICLAVGRGSSQDNITIVSWVARDIHSRHHASSPHISPFSIDS